VASFAVLVTRSRRRVSSGVYLLFGGGAGEIVGGSNSREGSSDQGLLTPCARSFLERRISFERGLAMGGRVGKKEERREEGRKSRSRDRASASQSFLPPSLPPWWARYLGGR
jgi:hypothetical protein